MTTEILLLTEANKELLGNVGEDVFDYPIQAAYLAAFLADPRHIMYLAVEDGTVVGMASAVEYVHPDKPAQLWINEVGVASSHRRRGIGRVLVAELLQAAQGKGCIYAWLGTELDNQAAQACFSSIPGTAAPQQFLLFEWDFEAAL